MENRIKMFAEVENCIEKMIYEKGIDDIYSLLDTYGSECEHYIRTRALAEINNIIYEYKDEMCN